MTFSSSAVAGSRQDCRNVPRSADDQLAYMAVLPNNGIEFPPRLPFEQWLNIGRHLSAIRSSSAWSLGDWLVYGMKSYSGRYRNAVERTSLDYQTLRNYAWVAKRFPLSRRRDTLSFAHHAEVAALPDPEQDYWLRKATELGWSVRELRREVRQSLRERAASEGPDDEDRPSPGSAAEEVKLDIRISHDELRDCRAAADRLGLSTEEWIISSLRKAAHQILSASE